MQCIDVYKWQVTNVRNSMTSLFKQMNCTVGALLREFRKIFLLYIKNILKEYAIAVFDKNEIIIS